MSEYSSIIKSAVDEGTRQTLMDAFSLALTLHSDRVAAENEIERYERAVAALREDIDRLNERIRTGTAANAEQGAELAELRRVAASAVVVKADREKFMRQASEWQHRAGVMHEHLINVERRFVPEQYWTDPHPDRDHPGFTPTDEQVAQSMQEILRVFDQGKGS